MKKVGKVIEEMGEENIVTGHMDVQHVIATPINAIKPYGKNAKKHHP